MLRLIITFFSIFLIASCSYLLADEEDKDCTPIFSCTYTESDVDCPVQVHVTTSQGTPVQVDFFVGDVETGQHFSKVFTETSTKTIDVSCGEYISAKATYTLQNKANESVTLEAIDGGETSASSTKDCDERTCYSSPWDELDLGLEVDLSLIPGLK